MSEWAANTSARVFSCAAEREDGRGARGRLEIGADRDGARAALPERLAGRSDLGRGMIQISQCHLDRSSVPALRQFHLEGVK